MTEEGNLSDPFDSLMEALMNPRLADGQVIYLRAGTHYLTESVALARSDVTIQPYEGEVARIIFKPTANNPIYLSVNGTGVRFRNLEIGSEPTNRLSPVRGNHTGIQLGFIAVNAPPPPDGLFRNCTLHDLGTCYWYGGGGGAIFKDCLLYNFGWPVETGETDGEYLYTQNAASYDTKYVENCLFGPSFSVGFQVYAQSLAADGSCRATHYTFDRCVWFHTFPFVIAAGVVDDINFLDCCAWNGDMILGSTDKTEGKYTLSDCWWASGIEANDDPQFGTFAESDVQNNRLATINPLGRYFYHPAVDATWGAAAERIWNNHEYYGAAAITFPNGQTFAQWQANTGYDANSTISPLLPLANWVRLFPCAELPRIAHVVIYNWAQDNNVTVDFSSLNLANGSYRLRNAYDPLVDYTDIVYSGGGTISVPMAGRTIATPLAYATPLASLDSRFGAFVLELLES